MEDRKEKTAPWLSVPQFGDWDQKGEVPDYSLDFSKIREMRKQNKRDVSRASLGNEEDLINPTATTANKVHSDDHHQSEHHYHQSQHSPTSMQNCSKLYYYRGSFLGQDEEEHFQLLQLLCESLRKFTWF